MDDDLAAQQRHRAAVLAPLDRLAAMGGTNAHIAAAVSAAFVALLSDPPEAVPFTSGSTALDPSEQGPSNSAEYMALADAAQRAPVPLPGDQQANDQQAFQDTVAAEQAAADPLS